MSNNDKWAGSSIIRGHERPLQVFNSKNLCEIVAKGGSFTWSNNRQNNQCILEKLDRSWCNTIWKDLFENSWVEVLPIACSDHAPIFLHNDGLSSKSNRRFLFEEMWLYHKDCQKIFNETWSNPSNSQGSVVYRFVDKIKRTAKGLIWWNKHEFGNLRTQITDTEKLLAQAQQTMVSNPTNLTMTEEKQLRGRLDFLLHCEHIFWAQRAKQMWLAHGEINTKYFHAVVKHRRNKARIVAIKDGNGVWHNSEKDIMESVRNFFQDLFVPVSDATMEERTSLIQQANIAKLSSNHLDTLNKPSNHLSN